MAIMNGNSELASKIIDILNLPKHTVDFSLHFPLNGVASVKCEFYPESTDGSKELPLLFKEYRLEEIKEADDGDDQ